jgi:transposase
MKLVELVVAVVSLIAQMRNINLELTKRIAQLTRKRPRSETLSRVERQLWLPLLGVAGQTSVTAKDAANSSDKPKRGKTGGGRAELPAHLRRVIIVNPVPDEQRRCPRCGAQMTTIGHSVCERLTIIPAQIAVEQRLDETVACPSDDTIVSAAAPPAIIERGKLSDTFIVEATCDKYLEHMPVERQCARLSRSGVDVAPPTLGRGVAAHIDLVTPIATLIAEQTRGPGLLGTDATAIPVLDPSMTEGIRNGAIWCWTNASWVSFDYARSADSDSVRKFLGKDLARTVQCDGTNVTSFLERAGGKRPGCWSHGRRRLVEAARSGDAIALEGLRKIARIFAVERDAKLAGDSAEQRRARRAEHTTPILKALRVWVDEQRALVPPKTALGQALGYLHRQWHRLVLFMDDGNIEATNNRRERELRRLIVGRKNWLFTWLDVGAERTAAILSIIATCIAHDVNPRAYLHLVTKLIVNGWPNSKLRELLPDRMLVAHPELFVGVLAHWPQPTLPA